jgi:hypothetical protein
MPRQKREPEPTPRLYIATAAIPPIHARKGDYVLDDHSGSVCVFHGEKAELLTEQVRWFLQPVEVQP